MQKSLSKEKDYSTKTGKHMLQKIEIVILISILLWSFEEHK